MLHRGMCRVQKSLKLLPEVVCTKENDDCFYRGDYKLQFWRQPERDSLLILCNKCIMKARRHMRGHPGISAAGSELKKLQL